LVHLPQTHGENASTRKDLTGATGSEKEVADRETVSGGWYSNALAYATDGDGLRNGRKKGDYDSVRTQKGY